MTQVLRSPSHLPSPPTPPLPRVPSCGDVEIHAAPSSSVDGDLTLVDIEDGEAGKGEQRDRDEVPLLALLVTLLRKSWVACHNTDREELSSTMEIGSPTNVRHVAHVTFDRFNGFLGLPDEFEPDVPRRPPSASASVFGVSTDSMQLSFDSRGNSVPTILLLMQNRLYAQGGLQVEGIFRINAENSQEEYVRDQLNRGVLPDVLHVHCLAGLLKAWFRELPTGVLDSLSSEQVMQSQTEEECARLVHLLPPTEAALLNWAVNLMADVAQFEHVNKMNARNIAMVFAPNMTHMADPLTALMHAVHVMNFLKTLIVQTLEERNGFVMEPPAVSHGDPSDDNGHHGSSQPFESVSEVGDEESSEDQFLAVEESASLSLDHSPEAGSKRESEGVDMANGILEVTGSVVVKNLAHKAGPGPLGLVLENKYKGEGKHNIIRLVRFPRTDRVEAWR